MQYLSNDLYRHYSVYCQKLKEKNLLRSLPSNNIANLIADFSHNDYLKMSKMLSVSNSSTHSGGSRLIQNLQIFSDLEAKIAKDKNFEDAMILNSGFIGNATVIAALLDKQVLLAEPLVFADKAVHSSIHLGIKIASAREVRYNHLDLDHLESLLKGHEQHNNPKFIFSETIFSMDGDVLDIEKMVHIAKKYDAFLYLDEAHDIGVCGKNGYGLTQKYADQIDVVLGSFSKALGCFGGYIACSSELKQYLINKCSGFIYSSALPPMIIDAASKAWDAVRNLDQERDTINEHAKYLRNKLRILGFNIGNSASHIVPIILGSATATMSLHKFLKENCILTAAIRPPSVAPSQSRLRVTICKEHTKDQLDYFLSLLIKYQHEAKL